MGQDKRIEYGSSEWKAHQYQRAKEEKRDHNYQYWSEKYDKMVKSEGWQLHRFDSKIQGMCTPSELAAKEVVQKLREDGNHARIVAGYCQNVQRIKMYSVIYKQK